ncbi:hypothetical protein L3Q82_005708 [Scortum barcoo]|uniref:Uncharacterized protein n=1 Tax=Scortum barcoo TaxID=214431 RepID=A0ACB8V6C7_9TELE|nr:hypothetical protein L3Q82_005708 [Scortum barcoo]
MGGISISRFFAPANSGLLGVAVAVTFPSSILQMRLLLPELGCAQTPGLHGAHAPGVRINPGHGEHDGGGGPLPAGAEHAGSSRSSRT